MIHFKQKDKKTIQVSEEDLLINVLAYLRKNFPESECVVFEINRKGKVRTEGAVAILSLIRNPEMCNHYNTVINTGE